MWESGEIYMLVTEARFLPYINTLGSSDGRQQGFNRNASGRAIMG
jgi:hypothetical protein